MMAAVFPLEILSTLRCTTALPTRWYLNAMLAVDGPTSSQDAAQAQGGRQEASASAHGNTCSCGGSTTHASQGPYWETVEDVLHSRARRVLACLDRATASGAAAVGGLGAGESARL